MNDSIYRMSLDIHEHGSQAVLKVKKTDTGRKLCISLREGGTSYIIADDCFAVFKATKPDGSVLYNNCTIENNEIIYAFTEQTCTSVGTCRCEIALYGLDDKLITSPRFTLLVDGTIYPDGIVESTDEFSALTAQISASIGAAISATNASLNATNASVRANEAATTANEAAGNANTATSEANIATEEAKVATQNASTATTRANTEAERASDAATAANNAAEYANESTTNLVRIVKNAMAVGEVEGVSVSLDDAVELGFVGCRIFGKTTQAGTPTPESPVDIVSVGDSGSIKVNVTGENDSQSMTIATPNGLPGIPVTTGGNYTDGNGQQWICDEIDFARGVYIQRINTVGFENAIGVRETRSASNDTYRFTFPIGTNPTFLPSTQGLGMCNALTYSFAPVGINDVDNAIHAYMSGGIYARCDAYETVSDFLAWAKSVDLKVQYILATPIERPLSEEEIAAYNALHTYRDNTTVSNDAGAWMNLEYVMDAKKYIDSLVKVPQARLSSVTLSASKWAGSNSLYSQVVSIAGITEYSKVDLLPSVEQLAIFFNKNVAFVTENEDGVVTVYAIGDKPTLDYTMQVQITEVEA